MIALKLGAACLGRCWKSGSPAQTAWQELKKPSNFRDISAVWQNWPCTCTLGVLESLDAQEWGLEAEDECVSWGSSALALS